MVQKNNYRDKIHAFYMWWLSMATNEFRNMYYNRLVMIEEINSNKSFYREKKDRATIDEKKPLSQNLWFVIHVCESVMQCICVRLVYGSIVGSKKLLSFIAFITIYFGIKISIWCRWVFTINCIQFFFSCNFERRLFY